MSDMESDSLENMLEDQRSLENVSPEEVRRSPVLQRAISLLLAVSLAAGSFEMPFGSFIRRREKTVTKTATSTEIIREDATAEESEVADLKDTGATPEMQKNIDEVNIAIDTAEAVKERGSDLISLDDIHETASNRGMLADARDFIQKNKDYHIRGEERHDLLEQYLEHSFQKIAEMKREGKASGGQIREAERIMQAVLYDDDRLVNAGTHAEATAAARKAGMISPEKTQAAMAALVRDNRGFTIDLHKTEVRLAGGETRKISDRAIMEQLVGNAPLRMPSALNQGVKVEGTFDLESVDSREYKEIQRDRGLIEKLVDYHWVEIARRLESNGVDVAQNADQLRNSVIESIVKGEETTFTVKTADDRSILANEGDFENIGLVEDIRHRLEGYFSELGARPIINLLPVETVSMQEKITAQVGANLEVIGGRISDDQLCRGNFLLEIDLGNVKLIVDREIIQQVRAHGIVILFDWLDGLLPAIMPTGEDELGIPTEGKNQKTGIKNRKDQAYRDDITGYEHDFPGNQGAVGFNKGTGSRITKPARPANLGYTGDGVTRMSAGGTETRKNRHTGKSKRIK